MPKQSRPRRGSLQYWPRKKASKILPRVNWSTITSNNHGLLGFIAYKVGMASAIVKDNTEQSMTKGKRISLPVTILEAPNMKILSVRFYNHGTVFKELLVSNDNELKSKIKISKTLKNIEKDKPKEEEYDDIRIIVYSIPKQTGIKKTPDLIELAISAPSKVEKFNFVKSQINKEITLSDFIKDYSLLDIRGLTKGKGISGPVKRFGITLKPHKSEKGVRTPGSLAPWHPARVTFHAPQAGQLGNFSRVINNLNVITSGTISEKNINPKSGFKHFGNIKSSYLIIKGSIQGPSKRQVIITPSFRPKKIHEKKQYELLEVVA